MGVLPRGFSLSLVGLQTEGAWDRLSCSSAIFLLPSCDVAQTGRYGQKAAFWEYSGLSDNCLKLLNT